MRTIIASIAVVLWACSTPPPQKPAELAPPTSAEKAPPAPPKVDTPNPWVIPAGKEQAVLDLLAPIQDGGEVIPGWKLVDISVQSEKILLRVTRKEETVLVTLLHADQPGSAISTTKSFKISASADAKELPAPAIGYRIAQAIGPNDHGDLWVRAHDAHPAAEAK